MNASVSIWLDAARPKTLPLAICSIVVGSSLAYVAGHFSFAIALLALITATLLQILSNLANDYGDTVQGTDNDDRIGPIRGLQKGEITQAEMKKAIGLNILLIIISGLALVFYALQNPTNIIAFILLGLLSILSSMAYTMGSKPYGYVGLGDVSVFIFFGLLGVLGTFFLHTGAVNLSLLLPAIGCGLFAAGVLNINNMRDIENDTASNKRTLVVRIGAQRAKCYHWMILCVGWVSFSLYLNLHLVNEYLISFMLIPLVLIAKHAIAVKRIQEPKEFIPMMPEMVKCALITNLIFAFILVLGS